MRLVAYILDDDGRPKPVDILTGALWHATANLHLCNDVVGDVRVSTVFYGMTPWGERADPELRESMVFGGAFDGAQRRYVSEDEAMRGHAELVVLVMAAITRPQTHDSGT